MTSISLRTLALSGLVCFGYHAGAQKTCNVTFNRLSMLYSPAVLPSVAHSIIVESYEEGLPGNNPPENSRCYYGRIGAGCTWGRSEDSPVRNNWVIQHEGYDAIHDWSADVQIHGNGCEGTVLNCQGRHGGYGIAPPGAAPTSVLWSSSACGLDGQTPPDTSLQQIGNILQEDGLISCTGGTCEVLPLTPIPVATPAPSS